MRDSSKGGGRIGIILNGSPLFTGGAGSGESEIRRYILEADLLEAIIALPTDMFYNTGIATYVWVLSNKKMEERKGKVQLINGVNLCGKMRKSLGSKRNVMDDEDIAMITRSFGNFEFVDTQVLDKPAEQKSSRGRQSDNAKTEAPKTFASKVFATHEFGYRRITIERPLRESYQFSDERLAALRFQSGALQAPMQWVYQEFGSSWTDEVNYSSTGRIREGALGHDANECSYGDVTEHHATIRNHIKKHFTELKEKQIKDLLDPKTWQRQKQILLKAKQLQQAIGGAQHDDKNGYDDALKATKVKLEAAEKKQITQAVSWKNPQAEKVIKKIHKGQANPIYGLFDVAGQTIEYKADSDLRDYENVALDPSQTVNALSEAYFKKEVQPHVPDAWIDANKTDSKDQQIGIVGYEIPFNRHFYVYQPPRDLEEIDADLDRVSSEIMQLLHEVHV